MLKKVHSYISILKWLLALVLIFGGFTVYKVFGVLASDLVGKEYAWLLKIISEYGLFTSVVISVGFFHHWIIAIEERKETERMFNNVLCQYVDDIVINSTKRGFLGITDKELDFGEIMRGLYPGDDVYWLITFDPRYKHHCRELEHAIKKGINFRMVILKDCHIAELRGHEVIGFGFEEFREYTRLFLSSLKDIAERIDDRNGGSLGVFVSDALPCVPLFIIIRKQLRVVEIYSSFYLSEPVGRMPYLHWKTELNKEFSFENQDWVMTDLFLDYFQRRWATEKGKLDAFEGQECEYEDFLYAPESKKDKCVQIIKDLRS